MGRAVNAMPVNDAGEVLAVTQFLRLCVPFDQLDNEALAMAARAIRITYHRQSTRIDFHQQAGTNLPGSDKLYIVRSGAVEIRSANDALIDRIDAGGCFGYAMLLTGHATGNHAVMLEDSLLYQIDNDTFQALRRHSRDFDQFFTQALAKRTRSKVTDGHWQHQLSDLISHLINQAPVTASPSLSAREAAQLMTINRVSSLMILDDNQLLGIVTDRDLRSRLVAGGLTHEVKLAQIMTPNPLTIASDQAVFEALLIMARHNIHHLPVVQEEKIVGLVTTSDIVKRIHLDPVYLIKEIHRQNTVTALQSVAEKIPPLISNLIARGIRAGEIGQLVTVLTDAITTQLISQFMQQLGEAPVPFVWLAFGSQGRQEQSALSDQDNGLLLADDIELTDVDYFRALAEYVCTGLNACGYRFCPGDVMAKNAKWRLTLAQWQQCFQRWIEQPDSTALMHASIFFDMRAVYGKVELLHQLQDNVLQKSTANSLFLACLTQNAVSNTTPLGLFRQFVVERNGDHKNTFDIKLKGILPITDIARIYALASGKREINTSRRLASVVDSKDLTREDSHTLLDAYEFLSHLRLQHQGRQLAKGQAADNYLRPDEFSDLTRVQLKDAFAVINTAQAALKMKFTGRYF